MATPTDDPTMETCDVVSDPTMETCDVVSDPTMETSGVISDVPMVSRSFPIGVVSANFKVTRGFAGIVENTKVNVGKLYLRQIFGGPGVNQSDVIRREGLGKTAVNNWGIYDGVGPKAKLVANTHGMHTYAGNWYQWFTIVFKVERFKGSTLQVMGANDEDEENEWAIVGGTGEFAMARGIINRRVYSFAVPHLTQELTMEFFCRMKVPAPTKGGTVGEIRGSLWEMEGKSQRLENVTIYHHGAVEGFQFSYVDEHGQIRTTRTWGQISPVPENKMEIKFGPSEFVKQIKGAKRAGVGWLSKFEIVTTHKTYGPFGFSDGDPYFSYIVPVGETVVGFFAKTDYSPNYVTTIGVYTI